MRRKMGVKQVMNIKPPKKLSSSIMVTALLAGAMTISACQQSQQPEANPEDSINAEESIPMSADPADPSEVVLAIDDEAPLNDIPDQDDTVATTNSSTAALTYRCSPTLSVESTYEDNGNQVTIVTDLGTAALIKINEGSNPEIYEVDTAIDGSAGFTQWRVADGARETGLLRLARAGTDEFNINTYECTKNN